MAVQKLDDGRIVCSNASYIHITPWDSEDGFGASPVTYDIVNIVGDSLAFTPDDNTINSKESEFKDDPLFENVTLGKYQMAGTCIDFQNDVMKAIHGWEVDSDGNAYAPNGYKDRYATIEVGFRNEDIVLVAPKVKLNTKANFSNFKTGTAEGTLAGTAYSEVVKEGKAACPLARLKSTSGTPATYSVKGKNFKAGDGVQSA